MVGHGHTFYTMKKLLFLLIFVVSCRAQTAHSNTLNWTASPSSGITGYNIYRSSTSGQYGTTPFASVSGTTLTFVDSSTKALDNFFYVVTAVCATCSPQESVFSNEVNAVTPGDARPSPPGTLTIIKK